MAKQILKVNAQVVNKNVNRNGGNVQLAVDVQTNAENKEVARKVLNYQTTDRTELASFEPDDKVTITFEK